MLPKISVITPSYNQGNFLEETICSVLDQNYSNLEYIIIDGGSTDNSVEIIKKYEKYLAYWVSEKDRGQTHAINKGFKKATGDIVGWMNSDDFYYKNTFQYVSSAYVKTNGKFDVYFGNKDNVDADGNVIRANLYPPFNINGICYTENMNISNQSALWKRYLFQKIGYLDEDIHFAMDFEFFLRMAINGASFYHIDETLGALRMYEDNKSSDQEWLKVKSNDLKNIRARYGIKKSKLRKIGYYIYKMSYLIYSGKYEYLRNYWISKS